ncbi:hypothetical protein [Reyranella sp.]|uniref:hypothetical protein n=1 Tax=Reyranella sp. TaxID=1929291 RepID=UPI0025FB6163|nr:hypothetical protein [Reyranella sp.]
MVGDYVLFPNPAIPAKPLIELIAYVCATCGCEISASVLAAAWLVVESVGSGFPILRHYRPANQYTKDHVGVGAQCGRVGSCRIPYAIEHVQHHLGARLSHFPGCLGHGVERR